MLAALQQPACQRPPRRCGSAACKPAHSRPLCRAAADDREPSASTSSASASRDEPSRDEPSTSGKEGAKDLKIPMRGYFALADTKAEVYSKAGEKFDPAKKGGRYKPEFIWNTDWQTALAREESLRRKVEEAQAKPKAPSSGFLSLSRMSELDRMDVDLSEALVRKRREAAEAAEATAAAAATPSTSKAKPSSSSSSSAAGRPPAKAVPVFSRNEAAKLSRTNRSISRTSIMVEVPALEAERARAAAEENARYEAVKVEQLALTLAFSAAGFAVTYVSYSPDVAASYVVGALGGFTYLRLLSKSVDALGGQGAVEGSLSQPRLLIPIILGLGYNRWNQLYADDLGVTLQLLPMLVGFFTYKIAVITRQYKDVFDGMV